MSAWEFSLVRSRTGDAGKGFSCCLDCRNARQKQTAPDGPSAIRGALGAIFRRVKREIAGVSPKGKQNQ
jgi:hypothetical protein